MTTKKTTTKTKELRRCAGSKSFGIEPHEAPIADFPVQPSRKDGLGVMCKPHWTEYTRALRQAAKARKAAETESDIVAPANGSGRDAPLGDAIDSVTEEADAA